MFKLISIPTKNLKKKQILSICKLKNIQWNYGIKSQVNYFKKKIKQFDIHNCLYKKKQLIGYTLLRKRKISIFYKSKKINLSYLLFDTLVINNKYRKKKLSNLMMFFNNNIILNKQMASFLICKKNLVNFYKKHNWSKLNKRNIKVMDHKFNSNGMFYNFQAMVQKNKSKIKLNKSVIKIYINK